MDSWMFASTNTTQAGAARSTDRQISAAGNAESTNLSAVQSTAYRDTLWLNGSSAGIPDSASTRERRSNRRNRRITSCLECRRRKLKCDRQAPCLNCTRFSRDCLYLAPSRDAQAQQRLTGIKERMDMLEKKFEQEVTLQTSKVDLGSMGGKVTERASKDLLPEEHDDGEKEEEEEADEAEDNLEPTPLATQDNIYEDNTDDELIDLGVRIGKMRISERVGGWLRPKLANEINDALKDPIAGHSRLLETPSSKGHADRAAATDPNSYIGPGPDYVAPSSGFFFAGINMRNNLFDYLPSKSSADRLISQYWHAVHYMCRVVHRPTFEAQYTGFWSQIASGREVPRSTQAIVFAAMLSAAISMTHEQVPQDFGISKDALVESLRLGTEFALAQANFLRTTKIDTMQAFVMYLLPLVRAEVSRAHSTLVGSAIRLAECMGLHRDGTHYALLPIDIQVRRLVWHQLCFLDIRTCEATGPRPQNRADDYDTKMPWNVDDSDLIGRNPEDREYWTDMTFTRICAECQEMRLRVWYDIIAIDKKEKSLTSVLVKIQSFIAAIKEKYVPILDESKPFQRLARLMLEIVTKTMYLQVLHRYISSTTPPSNTQRMPDRLRQVLIEAGLEQIEASVEWERSPQLGLWEWYRGAFNQYHAALLLLVEVYAYPMRKEAARIWKCLDYIFETPSQLAPKQKAELVLTGLRDRMETFHQMRKIKVSMQMQDTIGHIRQEDETTMDSAPRPRVPLCAPPSPAPVPYQSAGGSNKQGNSADVRAQNQAQQRSENTETQMPDIDWSEWEKAFDPAIYTGDLNVPNFDMANFTGTMSKDPPPRKSHTEPPVPQAERSWSPSDVDDLSDLNFGDLNTFLPALYWPRNQ